MCSVRTSETAQFFKSIETNNNLNLNWNKVNAIRRHIAQLEKHRIDADGEEATSSRLSPAPERAEEGERLRGRGGVEGEVARASVSRAARVEAGTESRTCVGG